MTEVIRLTKWCTYCRTHTHDDSECWCTRVVPAPFPDAGASLHSVAELRTPPALLSALARAIKEST